MNSGILSAEYCPFGKHSQTTQAGWLACIHCGVSNDPIVEGQIDAVMVPVIGHWTDINTGADQFRGANLGGSAGIQHILGFSGHVDPEILDTILVPAGIGDFLRMDWLSPGLILRTAAQGVLTMITHRDTS